MTAAALWTPPAMWRFPDWCFGFNGEPPEWVIWQPSYQETTND